MTQLTGKEYLEIGLAVGKVPEELDGTLKLLSENMNCCRFNRWGTLLAVGATDGRVYVVDFLTRNLVKQFGPHVGPITALSWSRDGRTILTGSFDRTCAFLDVYGGTVVKKICFAGLILSAQFNPRDDNQFLVLTCGGDPVLEWLEPKISKVCSNKDELEDEGVSCVAYDRKGDYVISGTSKGRIVIYDVKTQNLLSIVKQNSPCQVRHIVIPRRGCFILTNSMDKVIRRYDLDQLVEGGTEREPVEPVQKLSDIADRAGWRSVCCSYDGEFICGASTQEHNLYIWNVNNGTLIKILRGFKAERLHEVQWHPTKPIVLSVANGMVCVWAQAKVENWAAFAPQFVVLEENSVYREKEGQYDEEDEDASDEDDEDEDVDVEDEDVDVVNMEAGPEGCSSDEEDVGPPRLPNATTGPLWFIPESPDMGQIEEPQPVAPYADRNFLRQPAGGMPMTYEENDLRRQMLHASTMTAATAKRMVKAPYRSFE